MTVGSALKPVLSDSGGLEKMTPHQRQEAIDRLANGETLVDIARTFGVDPTTIGRLQH
jgi:hypothetical protein